MSEQRPFRISAGYLGAVALIFGLTATAWVILGVVTSHRTDSHNTELRSEVGHLWGGQHMQQTPSVVLEGQSPPPKPAAARQQPAARTVVALGLAAVEIVHPRAVVLASDRSQGDLVEGLQVGEQGHGEVGIGD